MLDPSTKSDADSNIQVRGEQEARANRIKLSKAKKLVNRPEVCITLTTI